MPRHRIITSSKTCLFCKKVFNRPNELAIKYWESKKFDSQKCNAQWQLANRHGIYANYSNRWNNQRREQARKIMLGNKYRLGHPLSEEHKQKMIKSGKDHWYWKGDNASYSAVHKWLVKNFGKANRCENTNCPKLPSRRFEYALIVADIHVHNRNNYKMLCIPCHRSFDSRLNILNVQM